VSGQFTTARFAFVHTDVCALPGADPAPSP
jgi:hypothetical protein